MAVQRAEPIDLQQKRLRMGLLLSAAPAQLLVVRQYLHFQGAMRHYSLTLVRP